MHYPLIIRRIVGQSMFPALSPNRLILASGFFRRINKGDVVVFEHQGLDKIKRVTALRGSQLYVLGDNTTASSDSRIFGWIEATDVKAKVIWPRV